MPTPPTVFFRVATHLAARLISALILVAFGTALLAACSTPTAPPEQDEEEEALPQGVFDTLAPLGLSGRVIFLQSHPDGNRLAALDLASGELSTLFTPPANAYLGAADVSPDGTQVLLAYAPPPENGRPQFTDTDLALLALDGDDSAEPRVILARSAPSESFEQPAWSPDGQAIYFTHKRPSTGGVGMLTQVERAELTASGEASQPEVLLENAMWPSLSPDGARLAYLTAQPDEPDVNELFTAGAGGDDPAPALPSGQYPIVDAHTFSPDGASIYFAAVNPVQTSRPTWWQVFAARPVQAHGEASDLYRVDLASGEVKRLTYLNGENVYAAFSPDGKHVAVVNQRGVFIMDPTGRDLVQVAGLDVAGSVDWVE